VLQPGERMGVARARNLGAQRARGDILVFSDAHVAAPLGWPAPLAAALAQEGVGAVGPAISAMHSTQHKGYGMRWVDGALNLGWLSLHCYQPYPVPLLCGCFVALRRDVFAAIGGFDPGLAIWGCEDAELSVNLWTRGYSCLLVPEVEIAHLFRPTHPYRVDWEVLIYNTLRMATVHFGPERLRRVVQRLAAHASFPAAFARLADSDSCVRRQQISTARRYDDNWFFQRFGMDNV
jgi:GT2 family glycosyltransferase